MTRLLFVFGLVLAGCGDSGSTADCVDLCTDAQAGDCTAITGSCASFCTALDNVQGPSNCTSQRNAYQGCLDGGANVCANDCDAQETALGVCIGSFCQANPNNPDCVTLEASF
jgi:hypothetical protein